MRVQFRDLSARRIALNSGGYDSLGSYYGAGDGRLYYVSWEECNINYRDPDYENFNWRAESMAVRASDAKAAKAIVRMYLNKVDMFDIRCAEQAQFYGQINQHLIDYLRSNCPLWQDSNRRHQEFMAERGARL